MTNNSVRCSIARHYANVHPDYVRALRMFHCLTLVSPPPWHLPFGRFVLLCFALFCLCFLFACLFSCLASARGFLTIPPRVVDLDDRQCFTARSAMRLKKNRLSVLLGESLAGATYPAQTLGARFGDCTAAFVAFP